MMKTVVRKLIVGVSGLLLESLSISSERVTIQRQQSAALRRVHHCERELAMSQLSGTPESVSIAQQQLSASKEAFSAIYSPNTQ